MHKIIEARDLTKIYGRTKRDSAPVMALDHMSFAVHAGEVFGFLGPNGAGKTTTIRLCTGIIKPTSGRILIAGLDIAEQPVRAKEHIGVVSDVANLYAEMTLWDNLDFMGGLHDLPRAKRIARITTLLQEFDLYDRRHSRLEGLSTGLRKRLTIAAALVHQPDVLFLDEPTTGLDVRSARDIRRMIAELSHNGTTIFLTTHYIEEADQLCQRVAIINQGRIVTVDTPEALKRMVQREHILEVRFDRAANTVAERAATLPGIMSATSYQEMVALHIEDPSVALSSLVDLAGQCGLKLVAINSRRPTLEDAFVEFTGLQADVMAVGAGTPLTGRER